MITRKMMVTMMSRASWNLRSILGIDEDAQTISLDATIRFQWRDSRVGRHPSNVLERKVIFSSKVKGLPQTGDHVTITPRGNSATDITKVFSHMLKEQHFFHGLLKDALDAGLLLGQSQGGERESLGRPPCSLCQVNMCITIYNSRALLSRIYRDGTVRYAARKSFDLSCHFDYFKVDLSSLQPPYTAFGHKVAM